MSKINDIKHDIYTSIEKCNTSMLCIRLYLVIKYRSVKGVDTENVVLFLDEHSCINYLELVDTEIL